MKATLHKVSAFCEGPLQGNPAGVCLAAGDKELSEAMMQALARRVGYSETAYPIQRSRGWKLRWFTPSTEVRLCGHATLATAWVLWQEGLADPAKPLAFDTLSGRLEARTQGDWIELDLPAANFEPAPLPEALAPMGDRVAACGRYGEDWLVEMRSQEDVLAINVDDPWLAKVEARGIAFTARSEKENYDIVSRFFGPRSGIPEDPVTGSAHCGLGPYWASRLGKEEIMAWQASHRGGALRVRPEGDRVRVAGKARAMEKPETLTLEEEG